MNLQEPNPERKLNMTDREKLEKARELVGDVQGNLKKGNAWADAACAMDNISDVIRALPEPKRFNVRCYQSAMGRDIVSIYDNEDRTTVESSVYSPELFDKSQEYCDLLNKGHEANDEG